MLSSILLVLFGAYVLVLGAEVLIRGAVSLAKHYHVSSLVVGLTVVSLGTSAPELFVNLISAYEGFSNVGLGNIIGANISNILLVLGVASLVGPLAVRRNTIWREIPFAIMALVILMVLVNDSALDHSSVNILSHVDGIVLLSFFFLFMLYVYTLSKQGEFKFARSDRNYPLSHAVLFSLAGVACLYFGGKMLVENAVDLARLIGISEAVIGLSFISIGTTLPELVTSFIAARKKQNDIAVGNIIGSNIINVFFVLGLTSSFFPIPFPAGLNVDLAAAIGALSLLFGALVLFKRNVVTRREGIVFLGFYAIYLIYLFVRG